MTIKVQSNLYYVLPRPRGTRSFVLHGVYGPSRLVGRVAPSVTGVKSVVP